MDVDVDVDVDEDEDVDVDVDVSFVRVRLLIHAFDTLMQRYLLPSSSRMVPHPMGSQLKIAMRALTTMTTLTWTHQWRMQHQVPCC